MLLRGNVLAETQQSPRAASGSSGEARTLPIDLGAVMRQGLRFAVLCMSLKFCGGPRGRIREAIVPKRCFSTGLVGDIDELL